MNKKQIMGKIAFNLIQVIRKYNNEEQIENWNDLNPERKTQVLKTVNAVIENPTITAKEMHSAWAEAKIFNGWKYAPVTDRSKKLHSCLINFEDLNVFQQMKDDLFNEVVRELMLIEDPEKELLKDSLKTQKERVEILKSDNEVLRENNKELLNQRNDYMEQIEVLENESLKLQALQEAGVDNWDGYSYAMDILDELKKNIKKD